MRDEREEHKRLAHASLRSIPKTQHMRRHLEQGFEMIVVKDAISAAITPVLGDRHAITLVN